MGGDELSDRQVRILRVIRVRIAEHGEAPTAREIGARVGPGSS
ncbi:hypothetical protein [Streptomyces sp. NBC_01304]|nr:hypothetical protein OG430_23435 [Streptomyces sp. NBC_01304]